MTQAQLTTYLAGKVGIDKKQSKGLLDELTVLVVKQEGRGTTTEWPGDLS